MYLTSYADIYEDKVAKSYLSHATETAIWEEKHLLGDTRAMEAKTGENISVDKTKICCKSSKLLSSAVRMHMQLGLEHEC